ncbi:MAG: hypothetical protein ACLGIA_10765 [Actinomycetes bacterium]
MTGQLAPSPRTAPAAEPREPDRVLGGHRRFLDALRPGTVGPRLSAALGAGSEEPCFVLDAKYEPGVRATVQYRLGDLLVRGDVLGVAAGVEAPGQEMTRHEAVVDDLGLAVSRFPHDPGIPTLPLALDAPRLLAELAEVGVAGAGDPRAVRLQLLRYRTGRRATFRVVVRARDGRVRTFVAKCYHQPAKASAVAAEAREAAVPARDADRLVLAPLVAHLPALAVVLHEALAGRSLGLGLPRAVVTGALSPSRDVARAAVALAAFHALPPSSDRLRPPERELAKFGARAYGISLVDPAAGAALAGLADRLAGLRPDTPPDRTGLVHGDCKPSQFLLRGADVALLDLDSSGLADPASDLGTFAASLRQLAVRRGLAERVPARRNVARGWADRLAQTFLDTYVEAAGLSASAAGDLRHRTDWYEGVALERKALRAFARSPLSPLPAALVDEAHRRLDATLGSS